MENNNGNGKYLSLKETIIEMRADLRTMKDMLAKGEQKFEDCNKNIREIIKANVEDKESTKSWVENKFVTKEAFKPIKKTFYHLSGVGFSILALLAVIGFGALTFFKDKIIK